MNSFVWVKKNKNKNKNPRNEFSVQFFLNENKKKVTWYSNLLVMGAGSIFCLLNLLQLFKIHLL